MAGIITGIGFILTYYAITGMFRVNEMSEIVYRAFQIIGVWVVCIPLIVLFSV